METVFEAKMDQENSGKQIEVLEALREVFIKRRTSKFLLKNIEGYSRAS